MTRSTPFLDSGVDPRAFAPLPVAPDEAAWSPTRGRYSCIALRLGGVLNASLANGG